MVLAAGLGTRMRPLTDKMPKPLVEVGGKALIDHVLDRLAEAGVERAVVNVHHFAEQIERHLASRSKPQIIISDERGLLLGTGGGVVKALPELGGAPFFHINSDTIWIDGVQPNLDAAGRDLRCRPRWTRCCCSRPPPAASAMPGAAISRMAPDGRLRRAASARWRPSSMPARRSCRPRCSTARRKANSRSPLLFDRAAEQGRLHRPAAGRPVDACRHARRHRAAEAGDQAPARSSAAHKRVYRFTRMPARQSANVFNIPASAPFLPVLIDALRAGKLVPGFPASDDPLELARATLYLPTRRACRLAREVFLDQLKGDAAILPRIVALGDLDEDEIAFAEAATGDLAETALALPPAFGAAGAAAAAGRTDLEMGGGDHAGARRAADRQYAGRRAGACRRVWRG